VLNLFGISSLAGSGYRGPNPWLNPTYNQAEDIERYKMMRASKLGSSEAELYKYYTQKEEAPEWLSATASAGSALHLLEEAKAVKEGRVNAAEEFLYDPSTMTTGHIDITYRSGAPADIKTVSAKRFAQVRQQGAFKKHVHQLNWYMNQKNSETGYLEYINRDDTSQRLTLEIGYDPAMYERDMEKVSRVRRRVEREIEAGILNEDMLPKTASLERLQEAAIEEAGQALENTKRIPYLEKVYQEEMDYLNSVSAKRNLRRSQRRYQGSKDQVAQGGQRWSGRDDNYNTIEGLRHGGAAEHVRKSLTAFGSGYQRNVSLIHVAKGTDTSEIEREGLLPSKTEKGLAGDAVYATTKEWFSQATEEQKSGLGIPYGSAFEFKVDPKTVSAGWSEGGFFGLFPEYKQEALSSFLQREDKPDIYEVTVPYKINPSQLKKISPRESNEISTDESSFSGLDAIKYGASATMLYAGLTAKNIPFRDRMEKIVGKKAAPFVTKAPAAIWLSNEMLSLSTDPSLENAARFGLGVAGWELGMRQGTKLGERLAKGKHKGIPGVIGHIMAPIASSALSSLFKPSNRPIEEIEGLHPGSEGLGTQSVREISAFGSGFDALKSYLQNETVTKGKRAFFSGPQKEYAGSESIISSAFSGRDDAYNTIEGLHPGSNGMGASSIRSLTDFGSGWDPLKALARNIFKDVDKDQAFKKLVGSSEFQSALEQATQKGIIGEGMFGSVRKMEGVFRGKKFTFARKTGEIGEQEVAAMRAAESTVAPSVYSAKPGQIDMELFSGKTLGELAPKDISALEGKVTSAFSKIHRAGYEHADPHLGNVFITDKDQIGIIDFGNARNLAEVGGTNAASGDIDIVSRLIKAASEEKSQLAAIDPFAAADPFAAQQVGLQDVMAQLPDPAIDKARAKRMKKFRQVSTDAVGIGHRAAYKAGRKHSGFRSTESM